jgi:hypothetical protein
MFLPACRCEQEVGPGRAPGKASERTGTKPKARAKTKTETKNKNKRQNQKTGHFKRGKKRDILKEL